MAHTLSNAIKRSRHYNDGTKNFKTLTNDTDEKYNIYFTENNLDKNKLSSWENYRYIGENNYVGDIRLSSNEGVISISNNNMVVKETNNSIYDSSFVAGREILVGGVSNDIIMGYNNSTPYIYVNSSTDDGRWCKCNISKHNYDTKRYEFTIDLDYNYSTEVRSAQVSIALDDTSTSFNITQKEASVYVVPLYVRVRYSTTNFANYQNSTYAYKVAITGNGAGMVDGSFNYRIGNNTAPTAFEITGDSSIAFFTNKITEFDKCKVFNFDPCINGLSCRTGVTQIKQVGQQNNSFYTSYAVTYMLAPKNFDPSDTVYENLTPSELKSFKNFIQLGIQLSNIDVSTSVVDTNTDSGALNRFVANYRSTSEYNVEIGSTDQYKNIGAFFVDIYLH